MNILKRFAIVLVFSILWLLMKRYLGFNIALFVALAAIYAEVLGGNDGTRI